MTSRDGSAINNRREDAFLADIAERNAKFRLAAKKAEADQANSRRDRAAPPLLALTLRVVLQARIAELKRKKGELLQLRLQLSAAEAEELKKLETPPSECCGCWGFIFEASMVAGFMLGS